MLREKNGVGALWWVILSRSSILTWIKNKSDHKMRNTAHHQSKLTNCIRKATPVESQKHITTTKHLYQKRLAHAEAVASMEHVRYLAYQCAFAHARWEVLAATSSQAQPDCSDTVRRYFDTGSYWGQHLFWAKWSYGDPDARRSTMLCWAHERHRETNWDMFPTITCTCDAGGQSGIR